MALRPRLSPGVPLSVGDKRSIWVSPRAVKYGGWGSDPRGDRRRRIAGVVVVYQAAVVSPSRSCPPGFPWSCAGRCIDPDRAQVFNSLLIINNLLYWLCHYPCQRGWSPSSPPEDGPTCSDRCAMSYFIAG